MSANDSSFEHHIQNSNLDHQFERANENGQKQFDELQPQNNAPGRIFALTKCASDWRRRGEMETVVTPV